LLALLQVYGIVTRCSLVRPKLVKSVHYCPNTGVTTSREYRDITALTGLPTGAPQTHSSQAFFKRPRSTVVLLSCSLTWRAWNACGEAAAPAVSSQHSPPCTGAPQTQSNAGNIQQQSEQQWPACGIF
jgi:hypothetical protein